MKNESMQIEIIIDKIIQMLLSYGFKPVVINGATNYVYKETYCIPNYVASIGFFLEYAPSFEEANKNWHCDGESFPLEMGEAAILEGIRNELTREIGSTEILDPPSVKAHAI